MSDEDRARLEALLETSRRRLTILETQAARFGLHVPAYIVMEIDDTRAAIRRIERELNIGNAADQEVPHEPGSAGMVPARAGAPRSMQRLLPFLVIARLTAATLILVMLRSNDLSVQTASPTQLSTTATTPGAAATAAAVVPAAPTAPHASVVGTGCLPQFFSDVAPNMQFSIEVGDTNRQVNIPQQGRASGTPVGPLGARLTENGTMIAALKFIFLPDSGEVFKVASVVDADCQPVNEYFNEVEPGSGNTLKNFHSLLIRLAGGSYALNFGQYGNYQGDYQFQFGLARR